MITARNYAAQAQRGVIDWAKNVEHNDSIYFRQDIKAAKEMANKISKAIHFALPDNGSLLDDNFRGISGIKIRLPYPIITIEYYAPSGGVNTGGGFEERASKRLVIAEEIDSGIHISAIFFYDHKKKWVPCCSGWIVPYVWDDFDSVVFELPSVSKKNKVTGKLVFVLETICNLIIDKQGEHDGLKSIAHDIGSEVSAVLGLIEALTCKNVTTKTLSLADQVKSKHRIRDGKLPLYETRILVVDTGSAADNTHIKTTNDDRASVRQHLRRGHIRRHPTAGNIWVNSCVVGHAELGVIEKQYQVK